MVVGRVVAASYLPGVADEDGYLVWDAARPAHFCGWPYENRFVAAYELMQVDMVYDGPEATAGERPIPSWE
jgi:hypothetical protein